MDGLGRGANQMLECANVEVAAQEIIVAAPTTESPSVDWRIDTITQFLSALFDERDLILVRPIETWSEAGRKRSRPNGRETTYLKLAAPTLRMTLRRLLAVSETGHENLFFGVCPRFGVSSQFDMAHQVRCVRALWSDIDYVTVEEANEKVLAANLPPPSIMAHSGNGVHVYWLLDEPYLIDDCEEPLAVFTEWHEEKNGQKTSRKYIKDGVDRVYLDQQARLVQLSPKAQYLESLNSGIAGKIGGDHTTDLSRILRLPGTLNRKNERNGDVAKECVLVECDPNRRYSIEEFSGFAKPSDEAVRLKKIRAMPLRKPRKPSNAQGDKISELIAASSVAEQGSRSEPDFAVCCYAIGQGLEREWLWAQVADVGKFAEAGRRYFDTTWTNAEFWVQSQLLDKIERRRPSSVQPGSLNTQSDNASPASDSPPAAPSQNNIIRVDAATDRASHTLSAITSTLQASGDCYTRADQLVVIKKEEIRSILTANELSGLLNEYVEFYFFVRESGEFRLLPPIYANGWLNKLSERSNLPAITMFTRNPVFDMDFGIVKPGFNSDSGIYYAGKEIVPRDDCSYLNTLLRDFCFRTDADRTNYIGLLLTTLLMPQFIGSKPAALFNGNQPELGKSILAQMVSILRDGKPTETVTYDPDDQEFEKRMCAVVRGGATTLIIDNVKGKGRNAKLESACLERSITDPILSFRLLGTSSNVRAENSHLFLITANGPDVSRDLVTRSVVINLYLEGAPDRRVFTIDDPEGFAIGHREILLGELLGMVERWKAKAMPRAKVHTRFNKRGWGAIIGGILESEGLKGFLTNAEEAASELDEKRREFEVLAALMLDHPRGSWTATELVAFAQEEGLILSELGQGKPRTLVTKMGTLASGFIDETFTTQDGRVVKFRRTKSRQGHEYSVALIREVLNLDGSAEPLLNLENF
jgi:hypothetical protein